MPARVNLQSVPNPSPAFRQRKGVGRAYISTPTTSDPGGSLESHRLQVKENLSFALRGRDRNEIALRTGISAARLQSCAADSSNKNPFAYELPALTRCIGPGVLRSLIECSSDELERQVRLGELLEQWYRIEREMERLLEEVA